MIRRLLAVQMSHSIRRLCNSKRSREDVYAMLSAKKALIPLTCASSGPLLKSINQ